MCSDNIECTVRRVIAAQFGVSEKEVRPNWRLVDELGADSYAVVELLVGLEAAFGRELQDTPQEEITTVDDIIRHVRQQLAPDGQR